MNSLGGFDEVRFALKAVTYITEAPHRGVTRLTVKTIIWISVLLQWLRFVTIFYERTSVLKLHWGC